MNTHAHLKVIDFFAVIIIFFLEAFIFQLMVNDGLSLILSYFNIYFQGISYWFSLVCLLGIQAFAVIFSGESQLIQTSKNIKYVEDHLDEQISAPELANTYVALQKLIVECVGAAIFLLATNIIL